MCDFIVNLIKLCAFVGSNCNKWIVMRGMEKAKFVISIRGVRWDYLVLGAKEPRYATGCNYLKS